MDKNVKHKMGKSATVLFIMMVLVINIYICILPTIKFFESTPHELLIVNIDKVFLSIGC